MPFAPHCVDVGDVWQVPFERQHPAQLPALQPLLPPPTALPPPALPPPVGLPRHRPPTTSGVHCCPLGHTVQLAPFAPHATSTRPVKHAPFASQQPGQFVELHATTEPPAAPPALVPPALAPPAVTKPPPVAEEPPPVAVPAPELLSEQAPERHVEPSPQVLHELPFVPHAELSKPERHSPEVSQQPVHVTEEHVREGPHADAVTTPSRRPRINAGTVRSMRVRLPHSTAPCLVTAVIQSSRTGNRSGKENGRRERSSHRPKFVSSGATYWHMPEVMLQVRGKVQVEQTPPFAPQAVNSGGRP